MSSEKFRRQLRQEAETWWQDGLIDVSLYEQLAQRYQFQAIEQEASNRFLTILIALGGIFLGLGVITFIAANWQALGKTLKVLILLGGLLAVNASGFYLGRTAHAPRRQRWGQALLLLGGLMLGAVIGLLSQMFHQTGAFYELCLVWSFGVLLMAYSLRLTSLGLLALVILIVGYLSAIFGQAWWAPRNDAIAGFGWCIAYMPLLLIVLFAPLAHWCRSPLLFGMTALSFNLALVGNLAPPSTWFYGRDLGDPAIKGVFLFALAPAFLWAYGEAMYRFDRRQRLNLNPISSFSTSSPQSQPFPSIARAIALIHLALALYVLAFRHLWRLLPPDPTLLPVDYTLGDPLSYGLTYLDEALLLVPTAFGWLPLIYQLRRFGRVQLNALNTGFIAICLLIPSGLWLMRGLMHGWGDWTALVAPYAVNLLLLIFAIALLRDGLAHSRRHTFWSGLILLVVSVLTRLLEYQVGLTLVALVCVLCGVGVLTAGFWFETKRPAAPAVIGPAHSPSRPSS